MARKYRRGKLVNSYDELMKILDNGQWVFMGDKPVHPSFLVNLSVKKLKAMIFVGKFFEAIKKQNGHKDGQASLHHSPVPHAPRWLIDSANFAVCQYPGCTETKQYPTVAEVEDKLSKQRNYKVKKGV